MKRDIQLPAKVRERRLVKADPLLANLIGKTPAEVEQAVLDGVTSLADAKNVLAKLAMVVAYLLRHELK